MNRAIANGLILFAALIWGTTFVAQQMGMQAMGPLAFTGIRFLMGALVISPLVFFERKRLAQVHLKNINANIHYQPNTPSHHLWNWLIIGTVLFLGAYFQQVGIGQTSVTNSGFITAFYVPLVPLVLWVMDRTLPSWLVIPAMVGCVLGILLLTLGGAGLTNLSLDSFNRGDMFVLIATIFWATHVALVGKAMSKISAPFQLAATQFVVCGVLATAASLIFETANIGEVVSSMREVLYPLLWSGVLSVGIAFTLQVFAQQYTHATTAAILFSSEFLFSAIAGAWFLNEPFGGVQWIGGALILISIVGVQLLPPTSMKKD